MRGTTSRRLLAALLGTGLALVAVPTAAQAAAATDDATPGPHRPVLTVATTDMEYGQPDLYGVRWATNTVTITNNSRGTVQYPMLTFPANGRDDAMHADWRGCPTGFGGADSVTCIAEPLAPGEKRNLTFPWATRQRGPEGPALVRAEVAADRDGTPVPGTAQEATWQVSFAPLTGTFDITASALVYGTPDSNEVRRGSTTVTVTNLTGTAVDHPLVTFDAYAGTADEATWTGCVAILPREYVPACMLAPLAPGEQRAVTFGYFVDSSGMEYDSRVRVDAASDAQGTVIEGTAAGTQYPVAWSE